MDSAWLAIPPLMLAVIVHEVMHGQSALWLGDDTAKRLGRLTLNPVPHIDIVGTIIFPAIQILTSGRVFFGWAKPVPVNMVNFRNPFRDMALVAVAGPASNLIQALAWAGIVHAALWLVPGIEQGMNEYLNSDRMPIGSVGVGIAAIQMSVLGIHINLMLMLFNLIPIPPLDGSRVLAAALPRKWGIQLYKHARSGMIGLMVLLVFFPGLLFDYIIRPIFNVILPLLLP